MFCPLKAIANEGSVNLTMNKCEQADCAWYLKSGQCAIPAIANNLDTIADAAAIFSQIHG